MSFYFFIVLKMLLMYLNKEKQREMAVKLFSRNVEGTFIVTICPCYLHVMGCKVPKDLGNCYNSDTDVECRNGLILPNFMSIPFDYLHLWFISMRHSATIIAMAIL